MTDLFPSFAYGLTDGETIYESRIMTDDEAKTEEVRARHYTDERIGWEKLSGKPFEKSGLLKWRKA